MTRRQKRLRKITSAFALLALLSAGACSEPPPNPQAAATATIWANFNIYQNTCHRTVPERSWDYMYASVRKYGSDSRTYQLETDKVMSSLNCNDLSSKVWMMRQAVEYLFETGIMNKLDYTVPPHTL